MNINDTSDDDLDPEYAYEHEQRRKRELAKLELFKELGNILGVKINEPGSVTPKSVVKKPAVKRPKEPKEPVRKSPRLSKLPSEKLPQNVQDLQESKEVPKTRREFFKGPERMSLVSDEVDDVKSSLQDLVPYIKEVPSGVSAESIQKSLDEFKSSLKNFSLSPEHVKKVGTTITHSLLIHPSESKLLIITGDAAGYMSFWNADNPNTDVSIYRPHRSPVFCLSTCSYNPLKLYATAIDGVVRSCDLEKMEFNDVYVTQPEDHTTYHAQMTPHTLLVAHRCGDVGLIDIRESKNPTRWVECHRRSVQTVQKHPFIEHEFVTSSGVGEAGIWDIRGKKNQKPLLLLPHPKGVKSAFFSPGGGMLLTSCMDDKIRIYTADKDHLIMSRNHNMQTGPWLRPFMAMWHPSRDDTFVIGSLNRPREVDIYAIHGLTLGSLRSPNLANVLSNCHFHRSLPVIAGANSSGYVHVFEGPD